MLGDMFVAQDIVLDVGFATARPRLLNLIGGSGLTGASRAAYDGGLAGIVRGRPFGGLPCVARLVSVRFLEPSERDDGLSMALRWEARAGAGDLFPALDADLALSPAGPAVTRLALAGIYRFPFGQLGAVADGVVVRRVADATVRALLIAIGDSLTRRASAAEPQPSCDGRLLFPPARESGAP
jgi:hypothetical protein